MEIDVSSYIKRVKCSFHSFVCHQIHGVRKVKIEKNDIDPLHLAEVEVYDPSGSNIARSGIATQSSTRTLYWESFGIKFDANHGTDGMIDSTLASNECCFMTDPTISSEYFVLLDWTEVVNQFGVAFL